MEKLRIVYKFVFMLVIMLALPAFGQSKNPFNDKKFSYVHENSDSIFGGDYRCKFIIKQILLRSFHIDNNNKETVKAINESLSTYGRVIKKEGNFTKENDPLMVINRYYAEYCNIPEQKWVDYLELPSLEVYFKEIQELKSIKK